MLWRPPTLKGYPSSLGVATQGASNDGYEILDGAKGSQRHSFPVV